MSPNSHCDDFFEKKPTKKLVKKIAKKIVKNEKKDMTEEEILAPRLIRVYRTETLEYKP